MRQPNDQDRCTPQPSSGGGRAWCSSSVARLGRHAVLHLEVIEKLCSNPGGLSVVCEGGQSLLPLENAKEVSIVPLSLVVAHDTLRGTPGFECTCFVRVSLRFCTDLWTVFHQSVQSKYRQQHHGFFLEDRNLLK